jgi:hypothetical protein
MKGGAADLVAERVVDCDHVRVASRVTGFNKLQGRLGHRQPVEHRGLDQQVEPVPAMRQDHRRQRLARPPGELGVNH